MNFTCALFCGRTPLYKIEKIVIVKTIALKNQVSLRDSVFFCPIWDLYVLIYQ